MKTRHVCLLSLGAAWTAGAFVLACGSSGGNFTDAGPDATADTTTDRMSTTFDNHVPDSNQVHPEGGGGGDGHVDGGTDGSMSDVVLVGNCSPVNGPACDIVKQNCPSGKECVIIDAPDAALGVTTACEPTQASEHLPVGHVCCPNAAANPCDKGLTCIGSNCAGDAGGGTCSPACCPGGDGGTPSNNCGTSPEGYIGQCDIGITETTGSGTEQLYTACTYSQKCIPLDVAPCGKGYECSIVNDAGAGDCIGIFGPDGGSVGSPAGGNCTAGSNACQDDTVCIELAGGDTCLWFCYVGGTTPFDAGLLSSGVGHGGCPSTYTCEGVTGFPSWLGACIPPT
jgi:hypothetical protein